MLATLAWPTAADAHAGVPSARSITTVVGIAGRSATLRLAHTVELNNAGGDVQLVSAPSRAAGIVLARTDDGDRYADRDFYVEVIATDQGLCAGSPCRVPLPARAWAFGANTDGPMILPAGDYVAVLLGEPGQRVQATLHLRGLAAGSSSLTATGPAMGSMRIGAVTLSESGRDIFAHGYSMHYSRHRMYAGTLVMFALGTPAVVDSEGCADIGDGPPPSPAGLCAVTGPASPQPQVLANVGGTTYGTSASIGYGPPDGYYGLGYQEMVGAAGVQRMNVADYDVVLPY